MDISSSGSLVMSVKMNMRGFELGGIYLAIKLPPWFSPPSRAVKPWVGELRTELSEVADAARRKVSERIVVNFST